jgi:hypothetical protein
MMPKTSWWMTEEDAKALREQIADAALRWCRSLCWHDANESLRTKKVTGASCFFLRFRTRYVGVTAAHVIRQFQAAKAETPSMVCQLQVMPFDLGNATIDVNDDLDIATFEVSARNLRTVGANAFDVSAQWPPDVTIERGASIQLIGFPEEIRMINPADRSAIFQAYGALAVVEDCNDRDIITVYDPNQVIAAPTKPALGFNMSGCSGGPGVIHETRNGIHRWAPVGLIVGGPRGQAEGEAAQFDIIRIRRIDCIDEDGRIRMASTGWLPG